MEQPTALLYAHDLMPGKVLAALVTPLREAGFSVVIAAGGVSAKRCVDLFGCEPSYLIEGDYVGTLATQVNEMIRAVAPAVCISGFSSPRDMDHPEALFNRAGHRAGAIMVAIEDVMGGHVRANFDESIDIVATTCDEGVEAIYDCLSPYRVVVAGNIAVTAMAKVPDDLMERMSEIRQAHGGRIAAFFTFGSDAFAEQVELLSECLKASGNAAVVWSIAPKSRSRPDAAFRRGKMTELFGDHVFDLGDWKSEEIIAALHHDPYGVVVSGGASSLYSGVNADAITAALETPATRAFRIKETGMPDLELVRLGIIPPIDRPVDLFDLPFPDLSRKELLRTFDGGEVVRALLARMIRNRKQ